MGEMIWRGWLKSWLGVWGFKGLVMCGEEQTVRLPTWLEVLAYARCYVSLVS